MKMESAHTHTHTHAKWGMYTFSESKAIHTWILQKEEINYLIPPVKWTIENSRQV